MEELNVVLREGLPSGMLKEFEDSKRCALLVRQSFLDLRDNFRRVVDPPLVSSSGGKGKTGAPKTANEIKLISFGKILENNKTAGQCRAPFGDVTGGVMVMHVVVQPSQVKTKAGKKIEESPKCSCCIM